MKVDYMLIVYTSNVFVYCIQLAVIVVITVTLATSITVTDYTKLYFLAVTTAQLTVNVCEQKSLYVDKICCQWNNSVYSMHGASLYKIILEIHIFAS